MRNTVTIRDVMILNGDNIRPFVGVKKIIISKDIIKVEPSAFDELRSTLQEVVFDKSSYVDHLESGLFSHFSSLRSVTLPLKIKRLSQGVFSSSPIEKIFLPKSVEYLGPQCFFSCHDLKEVIFEEGINLPNLGDHLFHDCTSLEKITIPSSVNLIARGVFSGCSSLKEVIFNKPTNPLIIEKESFLNSSIEEIRLPESVRIIAEEAFTSININYLKKIYIPSSTGDIFDHLYGVEVFYEGNKLNWENKYKNQSFGYKNIHFDVKM